MRPTDPNKNKIYKFLGVEQADGIKTKNIFKRVKAEVGQGTTLLDNTGLKNVNLIAA